MTLTLIRRLTLTSAVALLAACGGSDSGGGGGSGGTKGLGSGPGTGDAFTNVYFVRTFAAFEAAAAALRNSDPRYTRQSGSWHFDNDPTTSYDSYPIVAARAEYAHAAGLTGEGAIIQVIDAGFRTNHTEFSGKTLYSVGSLGSLPVDDHGTMVASIAAGNAGGSMIGIAPNADLAFGVYTTESGIAAATRQAIEIGAVVQNNSWGYLNNSGGTLTVNNSAFNNVFSGSGGAAYLSALDDYTKVGVVVFAVSNEADDTRSGIMDALPLLRPSLEPGWLAVINAVPDFDNTHIISAERVSAACMQSAAWCLAADGAWEAATADGGYGFGTGSSFAAPQVSGALALLAEAFPDLSAHELRQRLLASADNGFITSFDGTVDFGNGVTHDYDTEFGHGFLDIRAALLPIGSAGVLMAGGQRVAVDTPLIASGGAMGDAVSASLATHEIVVSDALNADFHVRGSYMVGAARPVSQAPILTSRLLAADLQQARLSGETATGLGAGGSLLGAYSGDLLVQEAGGLTGTVLVPVEGSGGSAGLSLAAAIPVQGGALNLGGSFLRDQGGLFDLSGPSVSGSGAVLASLDIGLTQALGPNATLSINGQFGMALAGDTGLLQDVGQVGFSRVGLDMSWRSVLASGDRLTLGLGLPTAVTSGSGSIVLPVARSAGALVYEPITVSLAPQDRQVDLSFSYQQPLGRGQELVLSAYRSSNFGNQSGAEDLGAVLAWRVSF